MKDRVHFTVACLMKQCFSNMKDNLITSSIANSRGRVPKLMSSRIRNTSKHLGVESVSSTVFSGISKFFEWLFEELGG